MMHEHCDGRDFEFLIGKSIVKVEEKKVKGEWDWLVDGYVLTCSDGTIIEVATNEGCGGCSNGWSSFSDLMLLENNHNAITNVICKYDEKWDADHFTLFIYYQNDTLEIEGSDGYGNGYYGGGFYVTINEVK